MSIWKGLGDLGKGLVNLASGQAEAERLLDLNNSVARRQVELAARSYEDVKWRALVVGLDHFAREGHSSRAAMAAELASYADSLRNIG
jgi:hypothetical protein